MTDRLLDPDLPSEQVGVDVTGITRFAQIPEWVVSHPQLSDRAVRTWLALWLCADWNTGTAEVSIGKVSDLIGKSPDTTRRALKELSKVGAVTSVPMSGKGGRQNWNLYRLTWDNPASREDGKSARGSLADVQPPIHNQGTRSEDLSEAQDLLIRWALIAETPSTRSWLRRWHQVAVEWIRAGGPVDDGTLQAMWESGCRTPGGWHWAVSSATFNAKKSDRWAELDRAIQEAS